jgi:hypothetical protein
MKNTVIQILKLSYHNILTKLIIKNFFMEFYLNALFILYEYKYLNNIYNPI